MTGLSFLSVNVSRSKYTECDYTQVGSHLHRAVVHAPESTAEPQPRAAKVPPEAHVERRLTCVLSGREGGRKDV